MVKEILKKFCESIGIEYMGVAPIGPYKELEKLLISRREQGLYTEFEEECLEKRIDPKVTMENVQSVIVCLFPYYIGEKKQANISKYAYALDYHQVVKAKLHQIEEFLSAKIAGFECKTFVDTGPLVDRYMAYLAGLGYYGVNGHIITDKYGSYIVIGYMLTNYPFPADRPLERNCIECGKCKEACPGGAILGSKVIDSRRCRSYLTQKKGECTADEIATIKKNELIFGCDVCQDVCPHNQKNSMTPIREFQENIISNVDYDELLSLSNKEFIKKYGNRAFSWRGKKLLIRNFDYIR